MEALALLGASAVFLAAAGSAPPGGVCPEPGSPAALAEDAVPAPRPGDVITYEGVARLERFLPAEIWSQRDRFFFDGMRLEVGPCHRDYGPPAFFRDATERFRGAATLDAEGRLQDHTAGLPFPPETIAADDPLAGLKWAWNWMHRYQAGGSYGDVRLTVVLHDGRDVTLTGDGFFVPLSGRSDRPGDDYRFSPGPSARWAAGAEFRNLSTGGTCAFREYGTGKRRPDIFVWNASQHRVQRVQAPDAEGALAGCLVDVPAGGGIYTHGHEPSLHRWRVLGTRDLLAPINASQPVYPESPDRDFGPSGVSFASDRWELRRALALEGRLKSGRFEDRVERFVWYLDLQTLVPLYYEGYAEDGRAGGLGIFVHRWSEDRAAYRPWPDDPDRPVRVLDSVGVALIDLHTVSALRTESWRRVGTPPPDARLQRLVSQSGLRGR